MIRRTLVSDAQEICDIYNFYVLNTSVTFEEQPVSLTAMQNRILELTDSLPWLVSVENETITGFAYAGRWSDRGAYRFTVESTVYVAPNQSSRGIGTQLYKDLLTELRTRSKHCVIAVIALPNPSSIAMHEKFGFQKVGHFQQIGRKFNKWVDVGHWELIL